MRASLVERLLSPIAEVRREEAASALLMTLLIFLLLAAYYLMKTAREHATWMTVNQSMVHTRRSVAENIAMGQRDGPEVLRSWMNSSGHRANILDPRLTHAGLGAKRAKNGDWYAVQVFVGY